MFNVEQAIMNWRRQMGAEGIKSVELLDELESHLRDEIERQMQSGADPESGFNAAASRIGQPEVLAREFSKLKKENRWPRFARSCCLVLSAFMLLINLWTLLEYELSRLERALGFVPITLVCLYVACLPWWVESLGPAARLRMMKVCTGLVFPLLLWPFWEGLEAEHVVGSGLGIVPAMVVWCFYAAIAMTSIIFSLGEAYRPGDGSRGVSGLQTEPGPSPSGSPAARASGGSSPLSQRLNPHAWEVLQAAHAEASRLGHDYIGTEHVLLGVIKSATGASPEFL